ncbi:MAG: family 20 glycosylhydrolase [Acidobacteria bacterium]|nr:family 20 glycosylhydrolase [Acidobacteriota bacterium]
MADAARLPEDPSYYRRLIDFCHDWNLNALLISLADDQGCALRFKSHPELITHRHALTHDQARQLAEYAHEHGVDLIPEIESFGHTRYITGVPQYAHLADRDPKVRSHFSAVIPVAPETLQLMSDLYHEVAGIFPSLYLHGGCDEVNWGGSELSRKALQSKTREEIWAEYLNSLDHVARQYGKEFIVWGDYVLHKESGILPLLNKDIIVMDWQYYVSDPAPLEQAARKVLATGLRAIGAPAIISCRWGPRAGNSALRNIDAYADAYRGINDPRALGVIVTNWLPSRYIQRSIWDSFAYAAVAMTEGSSTAREAAFRRFVEKFYGAKWDGNWSDTFVTLYDITPNRVSCSPRWMRPALPIPWRNEDELKAAIKSDMRDGPPFDRLLSQLVFDEALVRKNFDDFLAFRLCVEYLEQVYWRNMVLVEKASKPRREGECAALLIQTIAERDRRLLKKLDAAWDHGRPHDSAARLGPVFDFGPADQLLYTFHQAASFSNQLARDPEQFSQLLFSA